MAAPTSYTDETFKSFLHGELAEAAVSLGWTVELGSYDRILESTLIDYGVSTAPECSDIRKLRAFGRVNLWRRVMASVSQDFNFSADKASYSRGALIQQAKMMYDQAVGEAMEFGITGYEVGVSQIDLRQDPYRWLPDDGISRPV